MDDIERKALALVNEVTFGDEPWTLDDVRGGFVFKALCLSIEQHEAFRREVSKAVEYFMDGPVGLGTARERLGRFILPKPVDPLVEALCHCVPLTSEQGSETPAEYVARAVREFLANQGLAIKIVEDKP